MTAYRDRIRKAGFAELASLLTEGTLAFSHRSDLSALQRGTTVYEATLPTGNVLIAEVATAAGKRSRFRVYDDRSGILAEFVSSPTLGIFGNPSGTSFDHGDLADSEQMSEFVASLIDRAMVVDGDDFDFHPYHDYRVLEASSGLWLAEIETSATTSRGVGGTPVAAVAALERVWRERYAPMSGADGELIRECREDIVVSCLKHGEGYVLGDTDAFWHKETIGGGDDQFDALFDKGASLGLR